MLHRSVHIYLDSQRERKVVTFLPAGTAYRTLSRARRHYALDICARLSRGAVCLLFLSLSLSPHYRGKCTPDGIVVRFFLSQSDRDRDFAPRGCKIAARKSAVTIVTERGKAPRAAGGGDEHGR